MQGNFGILKKAVNVRKCGIAFVSLVGSSVSEHSANVLLYSIHVAVGGFG